MKGFYIEITNNLLDPKHRQAMKESVWLFMWFLDKMTSITEEGIGQVLGGKPIKYKDVKDDLGISEKTYNRWISNLKKQGYINSKRTPYGCAISVNKAKKRWGKRIRERSKMTDLLDKNGTSNKTISVDNNNNIIVDKKNLKRLNDLKSGFIKKTQIVDPLARSKIQEETAMLIRAGLIPGPEAKEKIRALKLEKDNWRNQNL